MSLLKTLRAIKTTQLVRASLHQYKHFENLGFRYASQDSTKRSELQLNNPVIQQGEPDKLFRYLWIRCAGHEVEVLDSYEEFLKLTAHHLGISYVKTEVPFRTIKRKTMLASRHVHKKYRVQYEVRTYFRNLLFKNMTGSTVDTFLEYVERNIPEGVLFEAEKHRLGELPFEFEEGQNKG